MLLLVRLVLRMEQMVLWVLLEQTVQMRLLVLLLLLWHFSSLAHKLSKAKTVLVELVVVVVEEPMLQRLTPVAVAAAVAAVPLAVLVVLVPMVVVDLLGSTSIATEPMVIFKIVISLHLLQV
ncbi:hypothetical protein SGRA_2239 [Saprospira grandis str. Lewin]|uniref:Uncharacterized protein n=1 Tax=Saprospira grandis (strain Lewin) TaxID=984262 RepID=H6L3M0_SAPGL|nr:hypothetical protein SGRA_2239 [Saprospira grandis str. Lewin]